MKTIACMWALLVGLVGCSSSSSGTSCKIEGSYSATGTPTSGDCPGPSGPVTDTITARPAGATGPDFLLEITGTTGSCALNRVDACTVQGKCDLAISDVITPGQTGTAQYSWTFTDKGFSGTSTLSVPPAKSLPNGCSGQASVTGTRQ